MSFESRVRNVLTLFLLIAFTVAVTRSVLTYSMRLMDTVQYMDDGEVDMPSVTVCPAFFGPDVGGGDGGGRERSSVNISAIFESEMPPVAKHVTILHFIGNG